MKEIELTQGKVALVDDEDFDWISKFKWFFDSNGYARRSGNRKNGKQTAIKMHREILGLTRYDLVFSDHIDGNRLNNCKSNLRIANFHENQRNQNIRKSNSSGFKGVYKHNFVNKWVATIQAGDKQIYLGLYETPEFASDAYNKAAIELHGKFANFGNGSILLNKD